jgi:mono/diheme cytochrome c family protein
LPSPFGTFYAPNISPDPDHGIGKWSALDFVNAMKFGVKPDGTHLYPAFPYTSYQRMKVEDLIDLKAYLDTLPPVASDAPQSALPFPFSIRRGVGLWKRLYVDGKTLDPGAADAMRARGAYLVQGPAHCGECHTPRNFIGGPIASRAYGGAAALDGKGRVPNITSGPGGIGGWSESDVATVLESGFTPDFDSLGGTMADVVRNTSRLTADDRAAIAAFLKSLPPVASENSSERGRGRSPGDDDAED